MNKSFQAEIIDYIKQNKGAETAELQKRFGISYKDAKSIIAELLSQGDLVYVGGVKYSYVDKPENPKEVVSPNLEYRRVKTFRSISGEWKQSSADSEFESDDDEDDADKPEIDFEEFKRLLQDDNEESDDEPDDFDSDFEAQSQRLSDTVNRALEKHAPISKYVMPTHSLWPDEEDFIDAVMNRFERLIKSDLKMGQQGAVKKSEAYLEAVRDTDDFPMIQVYERLVYEIKNISPRLYRQLKKQFNED